MKSPTVQISKDLLLYRLILKTSDLDTMPSLGRSFNYKIFCNKMGARLNYTNASFVFQYPQFGCKPTGKHSRYLGSNLIPNSRIENKGRKFDHLNYKENFKLPLLVDCYGKISNSLGFDTHPSKNANEEPENSSAKHEFPYLDSINVKRLYEDENDAIRKRFYVDSLFYNGAAGLNIVTEPSRNTHNYDNVNSNDNSGMVVNEINTKTSSLNSSNLSFDSLLCSPTSPSGDVTSPKQNSSKNLGKPSNETLLKVSNILSEELQSLFTRQLNYKIYTLDLAFENRIRGTVTVGIFPYIRQLSLFRLLGHFKYAFLEFQILKITQNPIDGTVRVRWRVIGISAIKSMPLIFGMKSYKMNEAKEKMEIWYDGFSTFYVNEEGLIYKHIADKMMPDEEHLVNKRPSLMARLAALMGRTLKPSPAVTTSVVGVSKGKTSSQLRRAMPLVCGSEIVENVA